MSQNESVWVFPGLYLSPVPLPIYRRPQGGGLFRETRSPSPFHPASLGKPRLAVSDRTTGWGAALSSRTAPPAASLVTSSRSAERAQPRPLNTGFQARARLCVERGRGPGTAAAAREVGGKAALRPGRGREGPCGFARGRAREGREEGTWRSPRPSRDPRLLVVARPPPPA